MGVKLVSVTPGAEYLIGYCARVSNPANQDNPNIAKLIRYCADNGHWSIFEMADLTVEITTSRAISAQILRHKSFSFQEFSQRYAAVQSIEPVELRRQDVKNRQNSIDDLPAEVSETFRRKVIDHFNDCKELYHEMLEAGIAKECARMVLPMSTTTRLYMKGSIRSWIHFLQLRTGNGTQKEHADIAKEIKAIFVEQFPTVAEALGWNEVVVAPV